MQNESKKPWVVSFVERNKPLVALIAFNLIAIPFQFLSLAVGLFVTSINVLFLLWCMMRLVAVYEISDHADMTLELWNEQSKLNKGIADVIAGFDERIKTLEGKE